MLLRRGRPQRLWSSPNGVGEPVGSFRTAWVTTVLKAHGSSLSGARADGQPSRRLVSPHFAESILHWHDLRHEYASRLVERGVPLSQVRDLLGHASIVTTERYDNQKLEKLQAAAAKLETGKQFEVPAPVTIGTNLQVSFKKSSSRVRQQRTVHGHDGLSQPVDGNELSRWLGVRDSNPHEAGGRSRRAHMFC
jgi:Phage integrase family